MAEDLGKRLLGEVEEVGLDQVFNVLRLQRTSLHDYFQLPQLDRLIQTVIESKPPLTKGKPPQPVIELTATSAGGGATQLLYHLIALAVLPTDLRGRGACAVMIDCDNTFSVPRLAQQLRLCLSKHTSSEPENSDEDEPLLEALKHVHVFRPQSLPSTIATLESLPSYLFDKSRHYSFGRAIGLVALNSASAFYWQAKAEEEDAALLAATSTEPQAKPTTTASSYVQLTTALKSTAATFSCAVAFTSWNLAPVPTPQHGHGSAVRSLRPALPAPLSQLPTLRLIAQRMPVRKFPTGISIEEAKREAGDRQKAVEEGAFECVINEWSVDERTLQRVQQVGAGFGFRIKDEGLVVDAERA